MSSLAGPSLVLMENCDCRRLDSLHTGDRILSVLESGLVVACSVTGKEFRGDMDSSLVCTHQGRSLVGLHDIVLELPDGKHELTDIAISDWVRVRLDDGRMGWDQIVSISPGGKALIFRVSTDGPKNFLVNGLVVHN